ncbi:hypothetical protein 035JT001_6 [Bacillus phage 035JT001]|nr:hypothetical protein 035JT001_6 [Bacillus phage 035JT001]
MYKVIYEYDHGTWRESRSSNWLDEEGVREHLKFIKNRKSKAVNIKVTKTVNVTKEFEEYYKSI